MKKGCTPTNKRKLITIIAVATVVVLLVGALLTVYLIKQNSANEEREAAQAPKDGAVVHTLPPLDAVEGAIRYGVTSVCYSQEGGLRLEITAVNSTDVERTVGKVSLSAYGFVDITEVSVIESTFEVGRWVIPARSTETFPLYVAPEFLKTDAVSVESIVFSLLTSPAEKTFWEVTAILWNGFLLSLLIFAVTLLLGIPLGLPIAFCSMSKWKPIKAVSKVIVWIVRGIPLMLQIFIIFYVPGLLFGKPIFRFVDDYFFFNFGIEDAGRIVAVLIAFAINYACYFSEIYRGGIESIPRGQYEAGYVLGLTKSQVFRKIVLKQVIKRIVPPMSNEIITLIKDTALANCIMVCEIIKEAKDLAATDALVWPLFYTGVFYLLFVGILTIVLGRLEKKLSYFRS